MLNIIVYCKLLNLRKKTVLIDINVQSFQIDKLNNDYLGHIVYVFDDLTHHRLDGAMSCNKHALTERNDLIPIK